MRIKSWTRFHCWFYSSLAFPTLLHFYDLPFATNEMKRRCVLFFAVLCLLFWPSFRPTFCIFWQVAICDICVMLPDTSVVMLFLIAMWPQHHTKFPLRCERFKPFIEANNGGQHSQDMRREGTELLNTGLRWLLWSLKDGNIQRPNCGKINRCYRSNMFLQEIFAFLFWRDHKRIFMKGILWPVKLVSSSS